MTDILDWHVAIYAANEAGRLRLCLDSVAKALSGQNALISVILNGTRDHSAEIVKAMAATTPDIELLVIETPDKSNAINQFYHTIRRPARAYGGVDGYVRVGERAFTAMAARLASDPHALAVSGVATSGRTMQHATEQTLSVGGQLHGQLHGLRPEFLDRMVERGIRLPVGLYRGDGLLASMLAHALDAIGSPWDNARIPGVAEATYEIPVLSPFRMQDVRRQFHRKIRQMRGRIEAEAVKTLIYTGNYEALPANADDMIQTYLSAHPPPRASPPDRAFQILAMRASARASRPGPDALRARPIRLT